MPTEEHFAQAAAEYDAGCARPGVVAMIEADVDGDPARTRAGYLRARAAELAANGNTDKPVAPTNAVLPQSEPERSEWSKTWRFLLNTALVVILFVGLIAGISECNSSGAFSEGSIPFLEQSVPIPYLSQVACTSVMPDIGPGNMISGLAQMMTADATVEARVTLRNNGVAGPINYTVFLEQTRDPLYVSRAESIYLEAGEEKTISSFFPEFVSGASYRCSAQAE